MIAGVSSGTTRAHVWRGIVDHDAVVRTFTQHAEILAALDARDAPLAEAVALVHVATTETWLREVLAKRPPTGADAETRSRARGVPARGVQTGRRSPS